jgi:hypothetical protein
MSVAVGHTSHHTDRSSLSHLQPSDAAPPRQGKGKKFLKYAMDEEEEKDAKAKELAAIRERAKANR